MPWHVLSACCAVCISSRALKFSSLDTIYHVLIRQLEESMHLFLNALNKHVSIILTRLYGSCIYVYYY